MTDTDIPLLRTAEAEAPAASEGFPAVWTWATFSRAFSAEADSAIFSAEAEGVKTDRKEEPTFRQISVFLLRRLCSAQRKKYL